MVAFQRHCQRASNSPRVVHVVQRDDVATGGALRVAYELVRRLPNHGYDAQLLVLYGGVGHFGSRLGARAHYLGIKSPRRPWQLKRFLTHLNGWQPDIVHFHDDLLWPQLLNASRRDWHTVIHAHGGGTPRPQPLKTRLIYACQNLRADAVVCITHEAKKSQLENVGFRSDLLHVIYNGIDRETFKPPTPPEAIAARARFGFHSETYVVGYVGRLHDAMKGCCDFIDVIATLPHGFSGLVVGSGPDEDRLRRKVVEAGLSHRVHFAGLLLDPLQAYHAMSAFCFTSRHEPFGLTIAEAMACEVPVVGFECVGGSNEILTNMTGQTIPQRDVSRMAAAVESAVRRDPPWQQRIVAAENVVANQHNWDRSVLRLTQLYSTLASRTIQEH
jgi:glycosyltransferase involved in cell wall biosynthesis